MKATTIAFLRNVFWGWLSVGVHIVVGLVISPVIIRTLGVERYGIWVLLFSTIDYLRLLDFGLRAAVTNRCARLRAREAWDDICQTVVTAMFTLMMITLTCFTIIVGLREVPLAIFNIPAADRPEAQLVLVMIALAVSTRLVLTPLSATLEAFQRFDLVNKAYIAALAFRSTAFLVVLLLGYGLVEMSFIALLAAILESAWNLVAVKQVLPSFRFSVALLRRDALFPLLAFARSSAIMGIANLISLNAPTTLLGFFRGPTEVAFYTLPFRLLMYIVEAVGRVSDVTSSVTAALHQDREGAKIWAVAVSTNRHCIALFLPVAIFLVIFGTPLLRIWISPEVAEYSGPLLPVLMLSTLAIAGQHNTGAVLIGQGKHAPFAYAIVLEVVVSTACLLFVAPRYGSLGTAWVVATAILISRGGIVAFLMCRLNGFSFWEYIAAIYTRPLLTGLPVAAMALALRTSVWPGRTWLELLLSAAAICLTYYTFGFFSVLDKNHRTDVLRRIRA